MEEFPRLISDRTPPTPTTRTPEAIATRGLAYNFLKVRLTNAMIEARIESGSIDQASLTTARSVGVESPASDSKRRETTDELGKGGENGFCQYDVNPLRALELLAESQPLS